MGYSIVMRHGYRYWSYDSSLKTFDVNNISNCCPEVTNTIKEIKSFDLDRIITSPYLRTRQTALIAQRVYYELTGKVLPISIDTRIGEYQLPILCTLKKPCNSCFDSETLKYYENKTPPLCLESKRDLIERIKNFYSMLGEKVLIVTHMEPLREICKLNGLKKIKHGIAQYNILSI